MIYDVEEQKKIIGDCLDWYLLEFDQCDDWFERAALDEIRSIPGQDIIPIRYHHAHPATMQAASPDRGSGPPTPERNGESIPAIQGPRVREEQEWRLTYVEISQNFNVEYRVNNGYLIPYLPLPLLWDQKDKNRPVSTSRA